MAGYSDSPYRQIAKEAGSDFTFTEFVSTEAIIRNSEKTFKMLQYKESERPIVFQVFGANPDVIARASKKIEQLNPDGIDLNMGCSVKKVAHKGAGAGLLKNPALVQRIIQKMVKNLSVPVTAKIRLGWDHNSLNYLEIVKILESEGASGVFVHGRTKSMNYTGKADWDKIAEIKSRLNIPVFGNGDILSYDEAKEKMKQYNLNGVLIGRAAQGNPWIFSGKDRADLSYKERYPVITRHLSLITNFYGESKGVSLFRKHIVEYLKGLSGASAIRKKIMKAESKNQVNDILDETLEFIPGSA